MFCLVPFYKDSSPIAIFNFAEKLLFLRKGVKPGIRFAILFSNSNKKEHLK